MLKAKNITKGKFGFHAPTSSIVELAIGQFR